MSMSQEAETRLASSLGVSVAREVQAALNLTDSISGEGSVNTDAVVVAQGTVTTATLGYSQTVTWNAGAVAFTAMKVAVTDTASAAGSLLLDLQVGGFTKTSVGKGGQILTYNSNDGTNYERGFIRYASNVLEIGHEASGTGTASRVVRIKAGASGQINILIDSVQYFNVGGAAGDGVWGVTSTGVLSAGDGYNMSFGTTTGTKIGTAVSQKIGFFNATPVVQPASADQAAVSAISGGESPTEAEHNALITLVLSLRTALVNLGLIKGSA